VKRATRIRRIGAAVLVGALLVAAPALAAPATVAAPTAMTSTAATRSVSSTAPYALDFTLPTESKAGCMVCHGDKNLTRLKGGKTISYYIDAETVGKSSHANQFCVSCHLDFAYKAPHTNSDWQSTAKLACKNCHNDQFLAFGKGAHRRAIDATGTAAKVEATKPLCGDCHGSHDIMRLKESTEGVAPPGKAELHARGYEVCGRCHQEYWNSYNDYYHGAAYKAGAKDAPACWDCHGWHDILPSKDPRSKVNAAHLVETCSTGTGCHQQHGTASDEFIKASAAMIHGKQKVRAENPLLVLMKRITDAIGGLFGGSSK
jgi:hypothetical protein